MTLHDAWSQWTSARFRPREQFDAWRAAVDESHLAWTLQANRQPAYEAAIEMHPVGPIRSVTCRCAPCSGARTRHDIARSDDAYFGLLLIREGSEIVRCGDQEAQLGPGDFVLWDSTQPVEFRILSPLHKITLLIPQAALRARLPQIEQFVGTRIDCHHGLGALTASHVMTLGSQAAQLEPGHRVHVADLSLELIATCLLGRLTRPMTAARRTLLERIKGYIERHLDDPQLTPQAIAAACGVSVRYLHLLFEDAGISVSRWILARRLEQCRRELGVTSHGQRAIGEIALRWGFKDFTHFSRTFRQRYGLSPRAYRKQHGP